MSLTTRNPVKEKLRKGLVSFGSWIQIGHPAVAELLAREGFDWIAADMEHTDIGIAEFTALARAMHGRGSIVLARVRENDTLAIRQVLDAGAWGVIVPLVNSAKEAAYAVKAAKFPPTGIRGTAFFRANEYGADFKEYMAMANDESLVIVMIETRAAVDNIEEIVAVEGVDGVFIGPYDLSLSYGVPGQLADPRMVEAKKKVLEACHKYGKAAGIHEVRVDSRTIPVDIKDGFTFVALGMDNVFIQKGAAEALKIGREVAGFGESRS